MDTLLDTYGCLTAAGFTRLAEATPGTAPTELATHVAGCVRCQRRLLAGPEAGFQPAARTRAAPPAWRIAVVLGAFVMLIVLIAMVSGWLSSPAV